MKEDGEGRIMGRAVGDGEAAGCRLWSRGLVNVAQREVMRGDGSVEGKIVGWDGWMGGCMAWPPSPHRLRHQSRAAAVAPLLLPLLLPLHPRMTMGRFFPRRQPPNGACARGGREAGACLLLPPLRPLPEGGRWGLLQRGSERTPASIRRRGRSEDECCCPPPLSPHPRPPPAVSRAGRGTVGAAGGVAFPWGKGTMPVAGRAHRTPRSLLAARGWLPSRHGRHPVPGKCPPRLRGRGR